MIHRLFAQLRGVTGLLVLTAPLSCSVFADWEQVQIADALRAAPPTVTHTAKIYAWHPYGQLVLVRDGPGPYTHPDPAAHDPAAAHRPSGRTTPRGQRSDASADLMDEGARHADRLCACPCARGRPPGVDGPPAKLNARASTSLKCKGHPEPAKASSNGMGRRVGQEEGWSLPEAA
jgi:hypothetical protein